MPGDHREHHLSAFGTHPLERVKKLDQKLVRRLQAVGILDVEQLVAIHAIPGMSSKLAKQLQTTSKNVKRLVDTARRMLPKGIAASVSQVAERTYPLGAILDATPEIRSLTSSLMRSIAPVTSLPDSVNNANAMFPVQNQGARGTCVAFGATALHEFYRTVFFAANPRTKLSEQFLYDEIKLIDGEPNICGTWLVRGIQVLRSPGECQFQTWPYDPFLPCNANGNQPANARLDAAQFRARGQMLNPRDVNQIKAALASNNTVVAFCFPVYDSWYLSMVTRMTGQITMRLGNEPVAGGHCVCLIGYQDDPTAPGGGFFILRNSWGQNWGTNSPFGVGNGTMPYQYISNEGTEAAVLLQPLQRGSVLAAFSRTKGDNVVHWSPDGNGLGSGYDLYIGSSPVTAMIPYQNGVLTAFTNAGPKGHRIHWSPNGEDLGSGPPRYDGSSPVTAMMPYAGGVLVAFTNAGGHGNRIWFSPDGNNLGGGELRYDGSSPVTAMMPYAGGVLVAFTNAGGHGNRIWFSPDGNNLGGGELRYDGSSPVTAMIPYQNGVLTAFTNAGPKGHRIHWSPNGEDLGSGPPRYDGSSPVTAMMPYAGGVLVAFTNAGGHGNPYWFSPDGNNLGGGELRYDGSSRVTAMTLF